MRLLGLRSGGRCVRLPSRELMTISYVSFGESATPLGYDRPRTHRRHIAANCVMEENRLKAEAQAEALRKWLKLLGYYPTKRGVSFAKRDREKFIGYIAERVQALSPADLFAVFAVAGALGHPPHKPKRKRTRKRRTKP